MTGELAQRWLVRPVPRPDAPQRLYCFAYAGAGAGAFRAWPKALGPGVEVVMVRLPGREARISEPTGFAVDDIAAAIAADADRPFVLYGHSMGGRLGYEVVRALQRAAAPLPQLLFVAACGAPHLPPEGPLNGISTLADAELLARLVAAGGMAAQVLAEPELIAMILPVIRADLAWLDSYQYTPEPPLTVPMVAIAGDSDAQVKASSVAQWSRQAGAGFRMHLLQGGHFFLHEQLDEVAALILAELPAPQTTR